MTIAVSRNRVNGDMISQILILQLDRGVAGSILENSNKGEKTAVRKRPLIGGLPQEISLTEAQRHGDT
jgi:hypothetical protein